VWRCNDAPLIVNLLSVLRWRIKGYPGFVVLVFEFATFWLETFSWLVRILSAPQALARILDINETYARDNPEGPD